MNNQIIFIIKFVTIYDNFKLYEHIGYINKSKSIGIMYEARMISSYVAGWKMYYTLIIVIVLLSVTSILDALSGKQNRQS